MWQTELTRFAAETGLAVTVCHSPPGTSKLNGIEHRLFSAISVNWRGFSARGRPAWSPARLALVLVLQFAEGPTDRQAADAVRARLDWKYPLGLDLCDPGVDASVLTEFPPGCWPTARPSDCLGSCWTGCASAACCTGRAPAHRRHPRPHSGA